MLVFDIVAFVLCFYASRNFSLAVSSDMRIVLIYLIFFDGVIVLFDIVVDCCILSPFIFVALLPMSV